MTKIIKISALLLVFVVFFSACGDKKKKDDSENSEDSNGLVKGEVEHFKKVLRISKALYNEFKDSSIEQDTTVFAEHNQPIFDQIFGQLIEDINNSKYTVYMEFPYVDTGKPIKNFYEDVYMHQISTDYGDDFENVKMNFEVLYDCEVKNGKTICTPEYIELFNSDPKQETYDKEYAAIKFSDIPDGKYMLKRDDDEIDFKEIIKNEDFHGILLLVVTGDRIEAFPQSTGEARKMQKDLKAKNWNNLFNKGKYQ